VQSRADVKGVKLRGHPKASATNSCRQLHEGTANHSGMVIRLKM
jgi:hypothetical protein